MFQLYVHLLRCLPPVANDVCVGDARRDVMPAALLIIITNVIISVTFIITIAYDCSPLRLGMAALVRGRIVTLSVI